MTEWLMVLMAVSLAITLWACRRTGQSSEEQVTAEPEAPPAEIIVPTCGECGAIVWENRTHGNTFCQNGHEDPEIVMKEIEEFDA